MLVRLRRGAIDPPRQVNHRVPPALEAIVMKAMALRPADRYPSAQALGQDVERWLADEPVSASREPLWERARRWMRRRRTAVAAIAAALVAATAGLTAVLVVQTKPTRSSVGKPRPGPVQSDDTSGPTATLVLANTRERARFELRSRRSRHFTARSAKTCCSGRNSSTACGPRCSMSATDFYQRLEELLKVQADQRSRGGPGRGLSRCRRADSQDRLARPRRWPRSNAGWSCVWPSRPSRGRAAEAIRNAGDSLIAVGDVQEATGDLTGALASFERARTSRTALAAVEPRKCRSTARPSRNVSTASPGSSITAAMPRRHLFRTSRHSHSDRRLPTLNPGVTQFQSDLAQSYHDIGAIHRASGRAAEALAAYERARAISQKLTEADPTATQFQSDLAQSHIDIGYMHQETGQLRRGARVVRAGAGDLAEARRRQPRGQLDSRATWHKAIRASARSRIRRAKSPRRLRRSIGPGRSCKNWPTPTPRSRSFRTGWR